MEKLIQLSVSSVDVRPSKIGRAAAASSLQSTDDVLEVLTGQDARGVQPDSLEEAVRAQTEVGKLLKVEVQVVPPEDEWGRGHTVREC